ncbi:MAG: putative transcription factor MBF1 like protein [bacterium]|jgi:transcriptional regulator with XRE-family HTH domain|nr:MAG: putative transcription factor MBF1 like protein [bacterium]KAF0148091.1 MAG: putative transcription factor MBF1 like protein [bacterium]KAF0167643.1 MAG: putative transcription factor MBF1 like protein [bacterium]TXT19447.1 MAG: putative transcription factor MBF1 like protein [bacterium]
MRTLVPTPFPEHQALASPEDLGKLVRAVRTAAGMTLEETALAVPVAKQTLQNLERGTGTVSLSLAFKVLAGLGIGLRWDVLAGDKAGAVGDAPDAT